MGETERVTAMLRGVIAPVVTPFDPRTGEIDREGFGRNLRAHLAAGLHGVVVAGSNGEAPLLDEAERGSVVEWAREVMPRDRILLAGAGAEATRSSVRLARQAAERGADAVLVVAPHYYGPSSMNAAALAAHYERLADASPIPVVLYNIPKYTHFSLPPALVGELARHQNVVGMKDSSGDPELLRAYVDLQSTTFRVLTGHAGSFATALSWGAPGGVLAVSMFAPALTLAIYEAARRGDHAEAAAAQAILAPLALEIVGALGVPGVKVALDEIGLAGGAPRPPLLPPNQADRLRVAALLRTAEVAAAV